MISLGWDIGYAGFQKIRGKLYQKMISQACVLSDAVMLVYEFNEDMFPENADKMRELRSMLMPYLLHTRNNGERTPKDIFFGWPGTRRVLAGFCPRKPDTYVDVYELSPIVEDVLLSVDSFLDWWPYKNPTDICFFKDEECWFGTTVHEYDMWIHGDAAIESIFADLLDAYGVEYERYPNRGPGYIEHYKSK